MLCRAWLLSGLMSLAAVASVGAQEVPIALPSDPIFEVVLIDGSVVSGRVAGLSLESDGAGSLVLDGSPHGSIALSRLFKLTRQAIPAPPAVPVGPLVVLPDGDRLLASIRAADDTALEIGVATTGDVAARVPLDNILGLVFSAASSADDSWRIVEQIRKLERKGETLRLTNGDAREGGFAGLTSEVLRFDTGGGAAAIERERIASIAFDPVLVSYPRPKSAFLELNFLDGSRLGVSGCRLERGVLKAVTRFGARLEFPWKNVWRVSVVGGAIAYLAQREAAGRQFVAYLGRHPESVGLDTTWDGFPIRLGGRPIERGLGMLPRTLLAYRINPNDKRFQATIGLDDRSGELASVVFRVLVDRKDVCVSPAITMRDAPIFVDVDLNGGRSLVLVAEFGERGDVQDSAVWAEARIVQGGR